MKLDRQTLMMMTAAAGAALTLSLSAGPTEQVVDKGEAEKSPDPLALAPCMVDVDGKEVCTKELTWSELSDEEKTKLTAAIATKRKAEAARLAEAEVEAETETGKTEKAKPELVKPVVRPVWGNGDGCPACGMG